MKTNIIPSEWLYRNSMRLDSNPYLMGAFEARMLLEKLQATKESLWQVTSGYNGGIYNGPQFVRNYVEDPAHGVPFVTGSSMLQADMTNISLLSKEDAYSKKLRHLELHEGMTLISCSGTIGRMVYSRSDFSGMWASQDVLKVVPNENKIYAGYLYAYLNSKFGVPQILAGEYGAVIRHLEPEHIVDLQVPRLGQIEADAHNMISESAKLRTQYQLQIRKATDLFLEGVGLHDITAFEWHQMGRDLGFTTDLVDSTSFRAQNYSSRFDQLKRRLSSIPYITLGDVCSQGQLRSGGRFKRVDADPDFGVKLIGQKEAFWLEPEGRWISPKFTPADVFVQDETILISAQGTNEDNTVFARAVFITGEWTKYVYTQHFLRVSPDTDSLITSPVLFAYLRSEIAHRCFRSITTGSAQQDFNRQLLVRLPIPLPNPMFTQKIEQLVREAYRARELALFLERNAIRLVERTIQEEADAR